MVGMEREGSQIYEWRSSESPRQRKERDERRETETKNKNASRSPCDEIRTRNKVSEGKQ